MTLLAEILGGVIAYAAIVLFACRFMAFGMGTLEAERRVVLDVFDGKRV